MKIYTWNINGFNTCNNYNGFSEIINSEFDFVCMQEVKISNPNSVITFETMNYEAYYNFSVNKGRNGVFIFAKNKPIAVYKNIGYDRFDNDGRFVALEYDNYILINVYMPHGGRDKSNLDYKTESYNKLILFLKRITKNIILVGDFNIACDIIDVENYKQNIKNTMFTESERNMLKNLCKVGLIDTYRTCYPTKREYTWWPYAFDARKRNVGWRIDYVMISKNMKNKIINVEIRKDILGSDHCPVYIELDNC